MFKDIPENYKAYVESTPQFNSVLNCSVVLQCFKVLDELGAETGQFAFGIAFRCGSDNTPVYTKAITQIRMWVSGNSPYFIIDVNDFSLPTSLPLRNTKYFIYVSEPREIPFSVSNTLTDKQQLVAYIKSLDETITCSCILELTNSKINCIIQFPRKYTEPTPSDAKLDVRWIGDSLKDVIDNNFGVEVAGLPEYTLYNFTLYKNNDAVAADTEVAYNLNEPQVWYPPKNLRIVPGNTYHWRVTALTLDKKWFGGSTQTMMYGDSAHIKLNNDWDKATPYVKLGGAYRPVKRVWVNVDGEWKPVVDD